jgi:hypothetical protein
MRGKNNGVYEMSMIDNYPDLLTNPPDKSFAVNELYMVTISVKDARRLNEKWHSRLPKIPESCILRNKYRICFGAFFEGNCYAIAIITSPVNPALEKQLIVELRRLAISGNAPKNTASWMLGKIVKDVFIEWPEVEKIISYQDCEVHTGTIYKAANWIPAHTTKYTDWNHASRKRNLSQSTSNKIRWEYLKPTKKNRINNIKTTIKRWFE